MFLSTYIEDICLADVIAIYMIVADVVATKADVIAIYMIVADVVATKADVIA